MGFISASAVLDHLGAAGAHREKDEVGHRSAKMTVPGLGLESIVLRDQRPMRPERLAKALNGAMAPEDWYRLLNNKVLFRVNEERLLRLLGARDYRTLEHDVLVVDYRVLVGTHANRVWLCHMNSGNTFPFPTRRSPEIFKRIDAYPIRKSGMPGKEVVEFVVDYSVPDIAAHVIEVRRMKGREVLSLII